MNVPGMYRRATAGFIMPPRSLTQTVWSALQGTFSLLLGEGNRADFIDMLEKGTIQEGVISQATAGPVMMLSLFHDLQSPLLKRNKFDATEFLQGVAPALENFHNASGALENDLHRVMEEAAGPADTSSSGATETKEQSTQPEDPREAIARAVSKNETASLITALRFMNSNNSDLYGSEKGSEQAIAVLNHEWMDEATKEPDSLAGQLSRMVTTELFQMHQVNAKMAFLLQNQARNITFREGSCRVNNVALLSARTGLFVERDATADDENAAGPRYEAVSDDFDDGDANTKTAVAAQLEVLYDVTQEFLVRPSATSSSPPSSTDGKEDGPDPAEAKASESSPADADASESRQTTIVSVALIQGWLKGGPDDGELHWKLALHRPAFEFPNIEAVY